METEQKTETKPNFTTQLLDGGILHLRYEPNTVLEVEDFKAGMKAYEDSAKGEKIKILVELGKYTTGSSEGRKYAQENNPKAIAEALVIHSLAQRMLTRFYVLFHHGDHPIRVFEDAEKAAQWLRSVHTPKKS